MRCSIRWCYRRARFPVEGTLWHACRLHHPTSPLKAPTIERVHRDWEEAHPGFEIVSLDCDLNSPKPVEEEASFFGFTVPYKEEKGDSDSSDSSL